MTEPSAAMRQTFKEMAAKEAKDILTIMACFILAMVGFSGAIIYADLIGPYLLRAGMWWMQHMEWLSSFNLPAVGNGVLVVAGLVTLTVAIVTGRLALAVFQGQKPTESRVEFWALAQALVCTMVVAYELARLAGMGGLAIVVAVGVLLFAISAYLKEGLKLADLFEGFYYDRYTALRSLGVAISLLTGALALASSSFSLGVGGVVAMGMWLNAGMLWFGLRAESQMEAKRIEMLEGFVRKKVVIQEPLQVGRMAIAKDSAGAVLGVCPYSEQVLVKFTDGQQCWIPFEEADKLRVVGDANVF